MTTKRHTFSISWASALKRLPLTARYLKLRLAQHAYDYHNQVDMEAVWRELGPVLGIKGHANVDNLRFTLGYNPVTRIKDGADKEKAELSALYKHHYTLQQDAVANGQGHYSEGPNFNLTAAFLQKTACGISPQTSDRLVDMLSPVKGTLSLSYAEFRKAYPKAAAALYRRHLSRQVEAKLKAMHPKVTAELLAWGKGGTNFNIATRVHGHTRVTLSVFQQKQAIPLFDETPEGQAWKARITDAAKAINTYLEEALATGKAHVLRSHYVTAQVMAKAKTKAKAAPAKAASVELETVPV